MMDWHKQSALIIFLAGLSVMPACRGVVIASKAQPSAELVGQVRDYLQADDQAASRLLKDLSGYPVEELEAALRHALNGPFREHVPTGKLPGRTLHVDNGEMSYGLYVPATYRPSRRYPLILCLHGAGFDGDTYLDRWQPRLGEDYILACPSIEGGAWWTQQAEGLVLAVLSEVSRAYHIDTDRVFLTGMSNGGIGTYLIGLNLADRFAALIPMAAVLPKALFPLLDNARQTPFYIIHGAMDQVMPVQYSRDVADYLKGRGYPVVYREHAHVHPMAGGHFFPKEELPSLLDWLKAQSRRPVARDLVIVRDRDHTGRADWARIDEASPEVGSFWTSEHEREESLKLQQGGFARLTVTVAENTFDVKTDKVSRYSLLLNRGLVDFGKPIRVITNGQTSFEGVVRRNVRLLLEEARKRPDLQPFPLAVLEIRVSSSEGG